MNTARNHQRNLWKVASLICLMASGNLAGQAGMAATQVTGASTAQQKGYEIFEPHRDADEIRKSIEQLHQLRNEMAKTMTSQHPDMADIDRRIYILQRQLEMLEARPRDEAD